MTREKFDNRRQSCILRFQREKSSIDYFVGFSLLPSNRVGEIFISTSEPGSAGEENARDGAILASLALQHGATLDELCASLTKNEDGSPATVTGLALELARQAHIDMSHDDSGDDDAKPSPDPVLRVDGPVLGGNAEAAAIAADGEQAGWIA